VQAVSFTYTEVSLLRTLKYCKSYSHVSKAQLFLWLSGQTNCSAAVTWFITETVMNVNSFTSELNLTINGL